jgi:hypothetical protein
MMMDTNAHPQHMNVVKHFVYVLSGCGKHSMLVWGLNQCTMVSFLIQVQLAIPQFSKNSPPPTWVLQCKGAPICPSTAYQGAKTLCIHIIWMWDVV